MKSTRESLFNIIAETGINIETSKLLTFFRTDLHSNVILKLIHCLMVTFPPVVSQITDGK